MTFEAPSELMSDAERDRTLDEIAGLGVTRVRALVYWRDFSAKPRADKAPGFDLSDPTATRPGRGTCSTGSSPPPARAGWSSAHAHRAGPRLGDEQAQRRHHAAQRQAVRPLGHRGRPPGGRERRPVVAHERAQPPGLPRPAVQRGQAGVAADLPRSLRRGGEGHPRRARGRRDKVLFGETAPIGNSNVVEPMVFPPPRALPLLELRAQQGLPQAAHGGLRPSRLRSHGQPVLPLGGSQRGLDRFAGPALEGARQGREGRRHQEGPADLPHGVRRAELPGPQQRRAAAQAGGVPRDLRAHRLREPARRRSPST